MQQKQFALCCAGAVLLALVSASYAAETPGDVAASPPSETAVAPVAATAENTVVTAGDQTSTAANPAMTTKAPPPSASQKAMAGTAVASNPPTVTNPQQIYLIRDSPFFNLHIEKAIQHAREAEIAGNMGEAEVLLENARISLMRAREAQRAGNVPGLNEGIANLKKALNLNTWLTQASMQPSSAEVPQASMQTSSAEMPQASMQASSAQVTG